MKKKIIIKAGDHRRKKAEIADRGWIGPDTSEIRPRKHQNDYTEVSPEVCTHCGHRLMGFKRCQYCGEHPSKRPRRPNGSRRPKSEASSKKDNIIKTLKTAKYKALQKKAGSSGVLQTNVTLDTGSQVDVQVDYTIFEGDDGDRWTPPSGATAELGEFVDMKGNVIPDELISEAELYRIEMEALQEDSDRMEGEADWAADQKMEMMRMKEPPFDMDNYEY